VLAGAKGIIVPSESVVKDVEKHFPDTSAKIKIISMGCNHLNAVGLTNLNSIIPVHRYFLFVGSIEPRKNLVRLLDAFEKSWPDIDGAELIIVGREGWLNRLFFEKLDRSPLKEKVQIINDADDRTLKYLYKNALALVYPSLGEGFGLPVAEAMSLGCPVIASDNTSIPEVAKGAALLVDPIDTDDISSALVKVANDDIVRNNLISTGFLRASELTWSTAGKKMLQFLRDIAM